MCVVSSNTVYMVKKNTDWAFFFLNVSMEIVYTVEMQTRVYVLFHRRVGSSHEGSAREKG